MTASQLLHTQQNCISLHSAPSRPCPLQLTQNRTCFHHSSSFFSSKPSLVPSVAQQTLQRLRSIATAATKEEAVVTQQRLQAPAAASLTAATPAAAAGGQESSHGTNHPQQQQQGLLSGQCLVAAGALACSFITLQVKLFDQHVPPLEVTACSSAVAWVATSCILSWQGWQQQQADVAASTAAAAAAGASSLTSKSKSKSKKALLLLRGLLGAATVTAYYAAVEELPLPVAVALFFFHPVLALLLDAAVSKKRVSPQAAASCALTVMGVLVIGWHDQLMLHLEQAAAFVEVLGSQGFEGATAAAAAAGSDVIMGPELSLYGVLMGLLAAAANAAAFVVVGQIGRDVPTLNVCWWQYCVTTHAAIAVLLLSEVETALVQMGQPAVGSLPAGLQAVVLALMPQLQEQQVLAGMDTAAASAAMAAAAGSSASLLDVSSSAIQQVLQHSIPSQHDALLLSGVVVANFAGQLLLNAGFQRVDAGRGAAINTLQVLFANTWDVLLLHSAPSAALLAGSGMIAAGVVGTKQSAAVEEEEQQQQQQVPPAPQEQPAD